jgi:8-oxo-dGTP pyrophosphatase MutT (NUDIX family)
VFPGGAIDVSDSANSSPRPRAGCVWNSDDLVASIDDLEATSAIAHVVGAIRESLEEAGVAIGLTRLDDSPIDAEQCNLLRVLHGNGNSFVSSLVDMQIGIDGSQLAYAAHWTTPLGASRRYSTRYFVALANESIEPVADGHELVSTDWWTPADAFAAASEGRIGLLLPIQKNLELIAQHDSVDALISATRANKSVPHMAPRIVIDDGVARVLLPGDDGYDQAEFGELPEGAPLPGLPGGPVHD